MSIPAHPFRAGTGISGNHRPGISKRTCKIWLILYLICSVGIAAAQQRPENLPELSKNPEWFPRVYKPYHAQKISEVDLSNSASLFQLTHEGKLRISLSQLKTAVNDNNLDILSSNNSARYAQTDLLRVKGGGAPRGGAGMAIPSSLFSGAIGAGVGGAGGLGGFGGVGGITSGAGQVFGFSRGSYDPSSRSAARSGISRSKKAEIRAGDICRAHGPAVSQLRDRPSGAPEVPEGRRTSAL